MYRLTVFLAAAALAVLALTSSASAQRIALAPDLDLELAGGVQPRVSLGVQEARLVGY